MGGWSQIELAVRRMGRAAVPVWSNAIKVDNIIKFNELGVGQMYPGMVSNDFKRTYQSNFWLRPNRLSCAFH